MPDYLSSYLLSYFADVIYWIMFIDLSTPFNLLPIPPLDGANIIAVIVPKTMKLAREVRAALYLSWCFLIV